MDDALEAFICIVAFVIIACFVTWVVLSLAGVKDPIPKGCSVVPVPETCHYETRWIMVGKVMSPIQIEVCDEVVACYNRVTYAYPR